MPLQRYARNESLYTGDEDWVVSMPDDPPPPAVTLTHQQLQDLIAGVLAQQHGGGAGAGAAAAGNLQPCILGRDKTKRYQAFLDWLTQAEAKMAFLSIQDGAKRVAYIRSNAGPELTIFWEKEVRARFTDITADPATGRVAQAAHTYGELTNLLKKELLSMVNRDRAVIDLLRMSQGDRGAIEFVAAVEDKARLFRADTNQGDRFSEDGFDTEFGRKALAENYELKTTIKTMKTSKANAMAMRGLAAGTEEVKRLRSDLAGEESMEEEIDRLERNLQIMRLRKEGKYSSRRRGGGEEQKCRNCDLSHEAREECSAKGKTCYRCDGKDHFARAPACPGKPRKSKSTKKVEKVKDTSTSSDSESSTSTTGIKRVETKYWPGTAASAKLKHVRKVTSRTPKYKSSKWVTVFLNGRRQKLFADTGSKYTIINPGNVSPQAGEGCGRQLHTEGLGQQQDLGCEGNVQDND